MRRGHTGTAEHLHTPMASYDDMEQNNNDDNIPQDDYHYLIPQGDDHHLIPQGDDHHFIPEGDDYHLIPQGDDLVPLDDDPISQDDDHCLIPQEESCVQHDSGPEPSISNDQNLMRDVVMVSYYCEQCMQSVTNFAGNAKLLNYINCSGYIAMEY